MPLAYADGRRVPVTLRTVFNRCSPGKESGQSCESGRRKLLVRVTSVRRMPAASCRTAFASARKCA
jgi:hypothetical protein